MGTVEQIDMPHTTIFPRELCESDAANFMAFGDDLLIKMGQVVRVRFGEEYDGKQQKRNASSGHCISFFCVSFQI